MVLDDDGNPLRDRVSLFNIEGGGRRRGGLAAAGRFPQISLHLGGDEPLFPKGVHRFTGFEESHSLTMLTRPRKPHPRSQRIR